MERMIKGFAAACFALFCYGMTGCGSSSAAAPAPDFSLTATPATVSVTAGSAGQTVSVTATAINGLTGTVSVAMSGLPAGVSASPSTLALTPGTPQNVTLTAGANAAAATATITLTGSSGTASHTAAVALTVAAAPPAADFSLTVAPSSLSLTSGAAGQPVSVTANPQNGFTGPVAVVVSGLPAGISASPSSLTLTPGVAQTVTLTAAVGATPGAANVTFTGTSGVLTHTGNLALTIVAAPADFSLAISPTSLTLVGGGAGQPVNVTAASLNSFAGQVAVTISGLPTGVTAAPATLTLTPGVAQSVTLTASASALAGTPTVTFTGTSNQLTHDAALALTVQPAAMTTAPDVTTFHYDNSRNALNAAETILTPANVNSTQFGKIGFYAVDGKVDGQPLYLANVVINGKMHNVLYAVTEHDSVYAFDADNGTQLWKTSALLAGETTSDTHGCNQIIPEIGITSTPVIDRKMGANGTLFTVSLTKDASGAYHHRLHALDLITGAETAGSPTEITASYPGSGDNSEGGTVTFDPAYYVERTGLLLVNGTLYLAWTSHCDLTPYTGWLMAYDETTLKQTQVLNITPNGNKGAVWMAGGAPGADSSGNIYFLDGNGTFDMGFDGNGFPTQNDFGNAMLKITPDPITGALKVADYFEPYNTQAASAADKDLGSGGEILLPDLTDASGKTRHLIVGGGKDTHIYLGDRDNLGKFNSVTADNSNLYQDVVGALNGGVFSTPAYFNGSLYFGAISDELKAFPFTAAKLANTPSSETAVTFGYPGVNPSISANGTTNGIVWALQQGSGLPAVLRAYDATNLGNELYDSQQAANDRDDFGIGNKYISPIVVNGKVYIGTTNGVAVFGLLPQ